MRAACGTAHRSPRRHDFQDPTRSARATDRFSPLPIRTAMRGWARKSPRVAQAADTHPALIKGVTCMKGKDVAGGLARAVVMATSAVATVLSSLRQGWQ